MNDDAPQNQILDASGDPITQASPAGEPSIIERMGWSGKSARISIKGGTAPTVGTLHEVDMGKSFGNGKYQKTTVAQLQKNIKQ